MDRYQFQNYLKDKEVVAVLTVADIKPETKMTDIFDRLISQLTESDFKFSR
jgi:hypothetical protein